MRAVPDASQPDAGFVEFSHHVPGQGCVVVFGEVAARDARLVGHHGEQVTLMRQQPHAIQRLRHECEVFPPVSYTHLTLPTSDLV